MNKNINIIFAVLCTLALYPTYYLLSSYIKSSDISEDKMYFCTAADERFYQHTLNLIGSIHRLHFDQTQEIAVFDLGFTSEQRSHINSIANVNVYDVELTHPDLLKKIEARPGKPSIGWYAWKPVCLKQSLDMFPLVLWLDAGTTVVNSLQPIFEHIKEQGIFLTECGHDVNAMVTQRVIKEFNLNSPERSWILDPTTQGAAAGIIGVSHKHYKDLILPLYKLTYNMDLFIDDGTAAGGPGMGRYEQALLSVQAHLLKLPIYKKDFNMAENNRNHIYEHIKVNEKDIRLHITEVPRQVHNETTIFCSRHFMPWLDGFKNQIKFKNQKGRHEANETIA